jgi:hypothetical protein
VHVAVVNQRRLLVDRYFCDAHGKDCVNRSLDARPFGNRPVQRVPGGVCCDVCLLLSRPDVIGEPNYVHLNEVGGHRWFSFYCGYIEAAVMLSSLKVSSPTRPFMHDVMAGIARALGGTIRHVLIEDFVADGQFYNAKLVIAGAGGSVTVDARPSDAISLAIRTGNEIFVSERLLADRNKGVRNEWH